MSEHSITTHIGEDIEVLVWFDYQPKEKQTHDDPGCDSEVTINGVMTGNLDGDGGQCLMSVLSTDIMMGLRLQCFESMETTNDR